MQSLNHSEVKLKIVSFNNSTNKIKEKSNNSRFDLDFKFYQKLFLILLSSCAFLIFPESPKDSEILCEKFHPTVACMVW